MDNLSSRPGDFEHYLPGEIVKIGCHCGETIHDLTDSLPSKGHIIPDQNWLGVYDDIDDHVIDAVNAGTRTVEEAYMESRRIISSSSRLVWQCANCGRLYVDGQNGELECFVPENKNTSRRVLRSRAKRG